MLSRIFLTGAVMALIIAPAVAGSPTGTFKIVGSNPGGGGQYQGTVNVTPTGPHTFRVVWHVGNQTVTGTGLWVDEKFAVGYQGDSIAVYTDAGNDHWVGHWANGTATDTGTENWTR
jgi:hypothetical protein